jgi:hypothetical protein
MLVQIPMIRSCLYPARFIARTIRWARRWIMLEEI